MTQRVTSLLDNDAHTHELFSFKYSLGTQLSCVTWRRVDGAIMLNIVIYVSYGMEETPCRPDVATLRNIPVHFWALSSIGATSGRILTRRLQPLLRILCLHNGFMEIITYWFRHSVAVRKGGGFHLCNGMSACIFQCYRFQSWPWPPAKYCTWRLNN
jgi:hypothetical protein